MVKEKSPFEVMLEKCQGRPTISGLLKGMLNLDTNDEIRAFAKDYETWLIENASEEIKGKEVETAKSNLGYIIGYCNPEDRKRLYHALSDVAHPVFGPSFGRS